MICLGKQVLIFLGIKCRISASKFPNPFSSAEVSLCRREAGEKEKSKRAGQDGREKERKLTLFPSSYLPPRAYYFSISAIFIEIPGSRLATSRPLGERSEPFLAASGRLRATKSREVLRPAPYEIRRRTFVKV